MKKLRYRNDNSSGNGEGITQTSPTTLDVLCAQAELTQEKSPDISEPCDGDVLIESADGRLEQMSHVADRVIHLSRNWLVRIDGK